jgi:amino acid adenylation domain-containing protein
LVWSFHHLLLDGWSLPLVLNEAFGCYEALARGRELEPGIARPYRDYLAWLGRQDRHAAEAYWREQLAGFRAPTPLGVDRGAGRAGDGEADIAEQSVQVSAAATAALKALGRRQQITLSSMVQGAWGLLLSRYSGEREVVFGVTVSGRPAGLPGVESMVGLFINTLPMRVKVSPEQPLVGWLKGVQAQQVEQRQYEYSPLVEIQGWSQVDTRQPLFETLLAFENYPVDASGLRQRSSVLQIQGLRVDERTNYPVTVVATPGPKLSLRAIYDRERFDDETIVRMLGHLTTMLEGIAARPEETLSELPLLTEGERHQVLVEWNATQSDYPRGSIAELFEAQVERTPAGVAVAFGGESLSYGELNGRANQLARHLKGLGVGPEARVAICAERSLEMVVGLLGILKAGGAYVPLDPSYPKERLAFMLEDSRVEVLLTQERMLGSLPEHGGRVVCLDRDWPRIEEESGANLPGGGGGDELAYVIYTSGSTGIPKGVAVSHRAVNRLVLNTDYVEVKATDRIAQASNASFDAATFEVWGALLNGACVVGVSRDVSLSPRELGAALREQGVTILFLTTALFNAVAREDVGAFSGLRHLLFGGEAVDPATVREVRRRGSPGRLLHVYGPTETTTFATWHRVEDVAEGASTVPIGRPIANTRVYVLDDALRPVPVGVAGELFIGGDGLARGYLGRSELTAEKFVPDPFGVEGGERLYRTGDLVRWLADGTIEFLGRIDTQVKIRGFRVELGEIESVLGAHPAVRDVVVLAREDAPGEKRLVAYVTAVREPSPSVAELRSYLLEKVPAYMVPSAFVCLESLPLNPNGKVDRRALPAPEGRPDLEQALVPPRNDLEKEIAAIWRDVLHLDDVGVHDNFFDLGGHSLTLLRVHGKIRGRMRNADVKIVDLFQYPTVGALAAYLSAAEVGESAAPGPRERARGGELTRAGEEGIAIIGVAGRFPGARDLDEFWRNLRDGVESISFFSSDELEAEGIPAALCRDTRYVKARGILEGSELFDASFFGYNPREAEMMDPQQRVFLETAWTALERAGYDGEKYHGRIGVYAGTGLNAYLLHLTSSPELMASGGGFPLLIASDKDFLTTRVSYKLNLRGPSVDVQTACSTSLVAVHLACQSLRTQECDMALAGGVSIGVPQKGGYLYQEEGILSPDGHCRAFDRRAQGTVVGSGVGIVVLKRLRDALADGDTIEAVIKGSAINNDGALKVGYTAPGVEGQAEVIAMAQAAAGVEPETVGYIEAHGTGTALGDPIEFQALRKVFRGGNGRNGSCAVGSVKTNIGHLDAAAGVAGLIKTVLAFKHRQIPPSLHFEDPNPSIDFAEGPFRVNARLSEWATNGTPRRAGVSSFGIGGTNAHVVLEEAPPQAPAEQIRRRFELLVLSAKTPAALQQATSDLATHLERHPELDLADAAYTLQVGRRAFRHRRMMVCRDLPDARRALAAREPGRLLDSHVDQTGLGAAFLFPGQGSQHTNMGRGLYESEEAFRVLIDRCAESLCPDLGFDLRDVLYPAEENLAAASRRLDETAVAQPALFVVEYALACLWMAWGVKPQAMLGHSVGEYVAACLAGVFSLEDALSLVATRGRLMQELPKGSMLAVALPEHEVQPLLGGSLGLAATNGPSQCVVSGPPEVVETLKSHLSARGVECHRLRTSHAFHSPMMEPVLSAFRERVSAVERHAPRIPCVSNVTGTWITEKQAVDPGYWSRHLRETVRFSEGISELRKDGPRVLLEVGPGQTLYGLARQVPDCGPDRVVASARHARDHRPDEEALLGALGRLWLAGVDVDWAALHAGERRRRVPLPTYPFERKRYWIDLPRSQEGNASRPPAPTGKKPDIADWFYRPTWRSSALPLDEARGLGDEGSCWLIFLDECGLGSRLAQRLEQTGRRVISVAAGPRFERRDGSAYAIRPGEAADYEALLGELRREGVVPDRIAHLWGVTRKGGPAPSIERTQDLGFYSLIFLAQALGSQNADGEVGLTVVTSGMQEVSGEGLACAEKATVLGPCRVIPQEYAKVSCRSIDILMPESGVWRDDQIDGLLGECSDRGGEPVVAHRRDERWIQGFEAVRLEGRERPSGRLRERGVYLITGGLGGIGLELARFLADAVHARLVLVGRTGLPPREEWGAWLESRREAESISRKIRKVQALEASGAEVLVLSADVSDRQQMEEAFARAEARFGEVHGVIHAAGVAPGGVIQLKTREMAERVLAPKVTGTLVLESLMKERRPDFVVLCSSLASVLGVPGQADYCAANAFQDAFARGRAGAGGPFVMSVNWDTWREAGMAVETEAPREFRERFQARLGSGDGILSTEGTEAFARALHQPSPRLLVSTVELEPRLAQFRALNKTRAVETPPEAPSRHPRPELATPYVAPGDEVEQTIADVWQELLGFGRVGIHDDFFDLGGHSLLAMQIVNRLRQTFQVPLKLQALFDAPTVVDLARAIAEREPRPGHAREIARLARSIGSLSDEEVERMLLEQKTSGGYD